MRSWNQIESEIIEAMLARRPNLDSCVEAMEQFHNALVAVYDGKGCFFTCGNGGSNADALHIVGELCKSFERKRTLSDSFKERLLELPYGVELSEHLESGLPAVTLGLNSPLKTAIENDCALANIAFAQELNAIMKQGDMLLAISTSGNATNCLMAMSVAKAKGGTVALVTGSGGGKMAEHADIVIRAPGADTKEIQEAHVVIWHTLCCLIEAHYFPE
ncbi:MAG: SIS domain-containing protein, partial [Candidatus Hydrogenedentes bacterium]|nr:SIS domain-containing protein [Candidatus Hydrogenedentota bacterium]